MKKKNPEEPSPSPLIRKEFNLRKPVTQALIYATCRGFYELSLNGRKIGESILTPRWTDYNKRIQYQTYDVTNMLQKGDNCIGAILGDGWYSGCIGWLLKRNNYGVENSLLAQLEIEYDDGTEEKIVTDDSWKCAAGPVLNSDMLLGENYDARREYPGWNLPGFAETGWKQTDTFEKTGAELVPQPCPPVKITEVLKPEKITEPRKGVCIFDLGQNMAGFVRLKVKGPAGKKITLRHGEMLNPDGTLYTDNLRKVASTDTYILKGEGEEIFQPRFTFHGFRYVEVTGYPGKPGYEAITGCAINSALHVTGSFECSNTMVNKLVNNITWSQRANFISIPTDCPQRDERLGWTGDAQIFVHTAMYNMDAAAFFTKWMQDVEDAQSGEGAFKDTCPYLKNLGNDGAPGWGDAGIIIPWFMYRCYADTGILEKHYNAMEKWMEYIYTENKNYVRKNRLNNNYGDWLNVKENTPKELLATAYWAYDAFIMEKVANVLGKEVDARKYNEIFNKVRKAFGKEFIQPDGKIMNNAQTAYALALYMNLYPEELREKAIQYLIDNIEKNNWHLSTGFLGVKHLNPVLTKMGYNDIAYRLLKNTTYPSWGYTIKHGATSIWERWDGWTKEKGFQDPGMNSFNHYSLGSIGEWLYRYVAGIDSDPDNLGFKHIVLHPRPGGGLTYAKADYNSIHGMIKSHWKIDRDTITLNITIPANTKATVYVPTTDPLSITEKGKKPKELKEIEFVKTGKDYVVYKTGSGNYSFNAEWVK